MVVGCVPEHDGQILLCKRAIEPRSGYWPVPAGFMELGETVADAARRETQEEACADVELGSLLAVVNIVRAGQVHIFYRASLPEPKFASGSESWRSLVPGSPCSTSNPPPRPAAEGRGTGGVWLFVCAGPSMLLVGWSPATLGIDALIKSLQASAQAHTLARLALERLVLLLLPRLALLPPVLGVADVVVFVLVLPKNLDVSQLNDGKKVADDGKNVDFTSSGRSLPRAFSRRA